MNLNSSPDFHFSQNGGFSNNGYTWLGVLEFLQEQYRSINYKETEWLLEKQQFEVNKIFVFFKKTLSKNKKARISNIEGELKAHESVNKDLIKRIKMLEYALRQERIKSSIQNKDQTPNNYESINNFFNENYENYSTLQNIINSNKEPLDQNTLNKRAKSHRPLLAK